MHKKIIITNALFAILSFSVFGNEFAVTITNLNLRESSTKSSRVISVIESGDTLEIIASKGTWSKVKMGTVEGFVSNEYLSKITLGTNKTSEEQSESNEFKDQKGFLAGFKYTFYRTFLLLFIIIGAFITYTLRKPDARFKKGYKESKMSNLSMLKLALYSAVVSVITGFIGGVLSIFH
jgi:uncharacterized protein YgiM (DUF1202 family)